MAGDTRYDLLSARVYILLPVYNEEEGIEKLLGRIQRVMSCYQGNYKVVIVNDGSHDRTSRVIRSFREMPLELIDFPENRGIAAVFEAGFRLILDEANDDDLVITLDADNTHTPYVIPDLIEHARDQFGLTIASRYAPGGQVIGLDVIRVFLSHCCSSLLRRVIGIPGLNDYSTFYRCYCVKLVRDAFAVFGERLLHGAGFSAMANFLVSLSFFHPRIAEVPITIRYDLKEGGSGLPIWKTTMGYLRLMFSYRKNRAAMQAEADTYLSQQTSNASTES